MGMLLWFEGDSVSTSSTNAHVTCLTARTQDKKSEKQTYFINIKSTELKDVVKEVLKDVPGLSLEEDKPSVSTFPISKEVWS